MLNKNFRGNHRTLPSLVMREVLQFSKSAAWVLNTFYIPYKAFAFPHVDAVVTHTFFNKVVENEKPVHDLIFGNSTGIMESYPLLLHRFIGENPAMAV